LRLRLRFVDAVEEQDDLQAAEDGQVRNCR
jgi:hypothetical protein